MQYLRRVYGQVAMYIKTVASGSVTKPNFPIGTRRCLFWLLCFSQVGLNKIVVPR